MKVDISEVYGDSVWEEQKIKLSETPDTDEFGLIIQITLQSRQAVMKPAGFKKL